MSKFTRVVFTFSELILVIRKTFCAPKMPFYAVANGRARGIFMSWAECEAQVKGFSGARYKKFDTVQSAQDFISTAGGNIGGLTSSYGEPSKNLKRTYTTSSNYGNQIYNTKSNSKTKSSDGEDGFSDDDDLNSLLMKQMDDIEKRVNSSEKGIEKIMKGTGKASGRKAIMIEPPEPKIHRSNNKSDFQEDGEGYVQVYTDGACSANGRQGARAGLGVYWGDGHSLNASEPVSGRATNNCGEIQAASKAIKQAIDNGITKLTINTDSQFLINSVTKWMPGWKRKGWKLQSGEPVKNEKDFKELDSLQNKLKIKWNYVEAHRGVHGNEMADQLAKAGAALYSK